MTQSQLDQLMSIDNGSVVDDFDDLDVPVEELAALTAPPERGFEVGGASNAGSLRNLIQTPSLYLSGLKSYTRFADSLSRPCKSLESGTHCTAGIAYSLFLLNSLYRFVRPRCGWNDWLFPRNGTTLPDV